jgi:transposase InsO family protein
MPTTTVKHVSILVTASGEPPRDIDVPRRTSTRDLLEQLGLVGHLSKFGNPAPFGENEELFSRIDDGDKLVLGPNTPVAGRRKL